MNSVLAEVANSIQERLGVDREDFRDQAIFIIPSERIIDAVRILRDDFGFNMLNDLTAVDYWPQEAPRFHLVYQLRDLQRNLMVTLRVPLTGNMPHVPTSEKVFPNANWHERELWDMFGIVFDGHSDLRRIIMPYDWEGHPLRKDYPLGYEEVQFTFNVKEIQARKPHPKE
ncbi:MAG: NADH-quinone oxidoreductase subunit C [Anaerolineaceae bacterium]|nr:NADH-quinone oxidoreductase subunit C [Anaerolineaceae bacterium]